MCLPSLLEFRTPQIRVLALSDCQFELVSNNEFTALRLLIAREFVILVFGVLNCISGCVSASESSRMAIFRSVIVL
ncbi:hypothetical protein VNO80_26790 [Phaseolus coccineus]|uniref:Uncharacterized protein n=1 Tax=Phaseolus coccineus TaxID=3886 RepID=A0AAN9LFE8_PHACN